MLPFNKIAFFLLLLTLTNECICEFYTIFWLSPDVHFGLLTRNYGFDRSSKGVFLLMLLVLLLPLISK